MAKAVKADKLAGKVTVKNAGESTETRDITLTATTASLSGIRGQADPEVMFAEKFGTFKKLTFLSLDTPSTSEPAAKSSTPKPTPKPRKKKVSAG